MIVTPKIFARLALVAILAVLLQLSFFSRVELLHTSADILPAVVVSLGLLGGSMTGAVAGFSIGFLVDCLLVAPLGGSSLVLLGVGYLAGLFRERFDIHSPLLPPLICMGATLLAELGFAVVQVMLGVDAPVSGLIVRDMVLKSIYAFFWAWPIYFGLRRLLRPALVDRVADDAAPAADRAGRQEGLMYRRSDELGPQMNNRLALRIAVFGGFALALFAILFFRLWFLQVLNGQKYLAEANNNRTREYRVSAPRGEILDRNGRIVVANRTSLALQVNPRKLPAEEAERQAELAQLAKLIHTTPHRLRKTLHEQLLLAPSAPVTVRRDVGDYLVYYLQENQDRFPGVTVQRVFVRRYPHGALRRPHPRQRQRDQRRTAEGTALQGAAAGRRNRPGRRRGHLRPLPARTARDQEDPGRRLRPADPQGPARLQAAGPG